jgi:hypothetical protein
MPRIDDPASSLPGLAVVDVDVAGLDVFAGSIEGELRANFQPQAARLMRVYEVGTHFGIGHASSDVLAARHRHTECLQAAVNQLAGYANATQILVEAARTVAARYRETDALAASNALEVRKALDEAIMAAGAAQAAATPSTNGQAEPQRVVGLSGLVAE